MVAACFASSSLMVGVVGLILVMPCFGSVLFPVVCTNMFMSHQVYIQAGEKRF